MKNRIVIIAMLAIIFYGCKKETPVHNGANFNKISFEISDTIFHENEERVFGVFTIDAHGLALEKIQFEAELETWEEDMKSYVEHISLKKVTPGNKVALVDSSYVGGSCIHKWTLINQEHMIDAMDQYQLDIKTRSVFENDHVVTAQIAFYIRNLFDDIEIIHGGSIEGYSQQLYFKK